MTDDDVALVHEEAKGAMEKALRSLRAELQRVRTGRASAALLDGIQVNYYGTPTPLIQLANLSTPDPRLIVIAPYDKAAFQEIEKAILKADLGLSPSNDGKVVRVPVPPLTEERRKELVKHLHKVLENHRTAVRNIRRDSNEDFKLLLKDKKMSEDEEKRSLEEVQKLTDDFIGKLDTLAKAKEKEILEMG